MAKRQFEKKTFTIQHKFKDRCVVPHEAIDTSYYKIKLLTNEDIIAWNNCIFKTTDNVHVRLKFIATTCLIESYLTSQIRNIYDMTYDLYLNLYQNCLGELGGTWHVVDMVKVELEQPKKIKSNPITEQTLF